MTRFAIISCASLLATWVSPAASVKMAAGGEHEQAAPDPNVIVVSPDYLHSCIQGPKSSWLKAPDWTKRSAKIFKEDTTCEEYFGLKEEMPIRKKFKLKGAPFCVDLTNADGPGLRECFLNDDDTKA